MRLGNLRFPLRSDDLGNFRRDPKQRVHACAEVRRPDARDRFDGVSHGLLLRVRVSCRANHQRLLVLRSELGNGSGRFVHRKIHDRIASGDELRQIVALINLANESQLRVGFGTGDERLAHPTLRSADDDFDWSHDSARFPWERRSSPRPGDQSCHRSALLQTSFKLCQRPPQLRLVRLAHRHEGQPILSPQSVPSSPTPPSPESGSSR